MKQGDLTAPFFHAGGNANNPLTPIKDALNGGAPFPNNQIPASRISPQSQKLLQFFPEPNLPGLVHRFEQLHRPNGRQYRRSPGLRARSITTSDRTTVCSCAMESKTSRALPSRSTRTRSSAKTSRSTSRT